MKVLYVLHEFFPRFFGGTERYVLNLAHQMQQMGHAPAVLTYGLGDPDEAFAPAAGGVLAREYVHEGVPVTALRHREDPADLERRVADEALGRAVAEVLERGGYDLMHVAHPMRVAAAAAAARRRRLPVVLTVTDFWLPCPRGRFQKLDLSPCTSPERGEKCVRECGFDGSVRRRHEQARDLFHAADAVIAPSDFLIEVFRRCGWERSVTRIRHGVDLRRAVPAEPPRRRDGKLSFGYTGVVAPYKGLRLLLDAFRAADAPNALLKIYGNMLYEEEFRNEVDHAYASDRRIRLMNAYAHDELPSVMADIDVMVVPSTTLESYGLVVPESLAFGVPVIASDMVGSAHDLIRDPENGFIFPAGDPGRLRYLIERLARDPGEVDRMRAAIAPPPRIEEEAFQVERVYRGVVRRG